MQWGGWSPQYPKNGRQPQRRSRDGGGEKGKDRKKDEAVVRSYDASSGSSSQLPSQAGGLEAQFMKEFLDMAKENNMTIPERLQKLIPDGAKDAIREQQKKLNKYRNVVHKVEAKKKAIEVDKEKWHTWLQEMKDAMVKQRTQFEDNQKKLRSELAALEEEERKLRTQDHTAEVEDPRDREEVEAEELLDAYMTEVDAVNNGEAVPGEGVDLGQKDGELQQALMMMQERMEHQYQTKLMARQLEMEQQWKRTQITEVVNLSDGEGPPRNSTTRNALAPFGVQRTRTSQVSSPYQRPPPESKEDKEKKDEEKEQENG